MSLPRYPSYKQSDEQWLGSVPESWAVLAVSRLLAEPVTDGPHTTPVFAVEGVPFLSVDGIQDGELVFEGCRYVSAEDHAEFSIKAAPRRGDVLLAKAASVGKVARVKTDTEFSIWSPLALIRVDQSRCLPAFMEYSLKAPWMQAQIETRSNSNTQANIGMKDIPKLRMCAPPMPEQAAIVRFLDHETAKIDALIAEQENLLALLAEKRQATISHAVTSGLDPNVPMKDSGIAWLGDVPAHWEVGPLKYFVVQHAGAIKTGPFGSHLTSADMEGGEIKVFNQRNVIESNFSSGDTYITLEKFKSLQSFETFPGDVLVTTRGTIGRAAILPDGAERGILHPCLIRVQVDTKRFLPAFFVALVKDSTLLKTQIALESNATTIEVIYSETMSGLIVPAPPIPEQEYILEFLRKRLLQFDSVRTQCVTSIDLLKERRSALIAAAVTGKIDVRGLAA